MPPHRTATVAERLRLMSGELTAAERKLMAALFANYPMAGLGSITDFAREADVSTPSVLRLAKKLGFPGFPALQEELRSELSAQLQNPIAKHERWAADAPDTHILNKFATAAMENLSGSLKLMDHRAFDAVVALLADRKRQIHIAGGRITGAIAGYLATHLQMARPGVACSTSLETRPWRKATRSGPSTATTPRFGRRAIFVMGRKWRRAGSQASG